jgi:glycosyltransferase involved in cell wall biosynthesis
MKRLARDSSLDFRFLVAGAGPLSEWLRDEAAKFPPNKIVLLGHLAKDELADYYANCDVFVHPNPREPFGNVALEAMASGLPALVANSGGVLTFANNENAWLAEANAEEFAKTIQQICADANLRRRKIANALETARKNSEEIATDRLFAAYDAFFEDFVRRKESFTDVGRSATFDFASLEHC